MYSPPLKNVGDFVLSIQGLKLLSPPFDRYDNDHGLISRYVNGRKEVKGPVISLKPVTVCRIDVEI